MIIVLISLLAHGISDVWGFLRLRLRNGRNSSLGVSDLQRSLPVAFIELTHVNGQKVTINSGAISMVMPNSAGETSVTFSYAIGDKLSPRTIKVLEPYQHIAKLLKPKR